MSRRVLDHVDRWLREAGRSFTKPGGDEAAGIRRGIDAAAENLEGRGGAILRRLSEAGG